MKIFHTLALSLIVSTLISVTGCQSAKQALLDQATMSNTAASVKPLYQNMTEFGEAMGCKSALQQQGTPDSDLNNAPKLSGTKEDYIKGWKKGFNKCLIGLGPVQLPVQK